MSSERRDEDSIQVCWRSDGATHIPRRIIGGLRRPLKSSHSPLLIADHARRGATIGSPIRQDADGIEELTGDLYEFEDKLTLMEDYVPDLKAWQVNARIRALAELCLVLINSNEFVYVY